MIIIWAVYAFKSNICYWSHPNKLRICMLFQPGPFERCCFQTETDKHPLMTYLGFIFSLIFLYGSSFKDAVYDSIVFIAFFHWIYCIWLFKTKGGFLHLCLLFFLYEVWFRSLIFLLTVDYSPRGVGGRNGLLQSPRIPQCNMARRWCYII